MFRSFIPANVSSIWEVPWFRDFPTPFHIPFTKKCLLHLPSFTTDIDKFDCRAQENYPSHWISKHTPCDRYRLEFAQELPFTLSAPIQQVVRLQELARKSYWGTRNKPRISRKRKGLALQSARDVCYFFNLFQISQYSLPDSEPCHSDNWWGFWSSDYGHVSMRSHEIVLDLRHWSCVFPILVMECRPRRGEEYGFCEGSSISEMVNIHIIASP